MMMMNNKHIYTLLLVSFNVKLLVYAALLLLSFIILVSFLTNADVIHYYQGNVNFTTTKVLTPKGYSNSAYRTSSTSSVTSSNNVSINIVNNFPPNGPFYINVSTFYVNPGSKLYIIPLFYNISRVNASNSNLAFSSISLNITSLNTKYNVTLVKNGMPLNYTFSIPLTQNFYTVNVTWNLQNNISSNYNYTAKILLMIVVQNKGANYVYFWSINIFSSSSNKGVTPATYYYIKEYSTVNVQTIINIINSLYA